MFVADYNRHGLRPTDTFYGVFMGLYGVFPIISIIVFHNLAHIGSLPSEVSW